MYTVLARRSYYRKFSPKEVKLIYHGIKESLARNPKRIFTLADNRGISLFINFFLSALVDVKLSRAGESTGFTNAPPLRACNFSRSRWYRGEIQNWISERRPFERASRRANIVPLDWPYVSVVKTQAASKYARRYACIMHILRHFCARRILGRNAHDKTRWYKTALLYERRAKAFGMHGRKDERENHHSVFLRHINFLAGQPARETTKGRRHVKI